MVDWQSESDLDSIRNSCDVCDRGEPWKSHQWTLIGASTSFLREWLTIFTECGWIQGFAAGGVSKLLYSLWHLLIYEYDLAQVRPSFRPGHTQRLREKKGAGRRENWNWLFAWEGEGQLHKVSWVGPKGKTFMQDSFLILSGTKENVVITRRFLGRSASLKHSSLVCITL